MSSEEKSLLDEERDEFTADTDEDVRNTSEENVETEESVEETEESVEELFDAIAEGADDLVAEVESRFGIDITSGNAENNGEDVEDSSKENKKAAKKETKNKKTKLSAAKKEKLTKRVLAAVLIVTVIAGIIPVTGFLLRAKTIREYNKAYKVTAEQPFNSGNTEFNVENISADEVETLLFGETEKKLADEAQEIYGDAVDISQFTSIGQYIKDRYTEDERVMVDASGKSIISAEYLYTQQQMYLIELDNVVYLIKAQDAVRDLHKRIVEDAFYTPTYEALKEETCFSMFDTINRMVVNTQLKEQLMETYSMMHDIITVVYGTIVDTQDINTTDTLPSILEGYDGQFNFADFDENILQSLWLASADEFTYDVYCNYYLSSEDATNKVNTYVANGDKYFNKLLAFIEIVPVTDAATVAEYMTNSVNEYIRKHFNKVNAEELAYITRKLDADFWLWNYMLGNYGAIKPGEMMYVTDSDRFMDYQIEVIAASGSDEAVKRYSWAYAHQLTLAYIVFLAGSDEMPLESVVGSRNEELVESYSSLYQVLASDGVRRVNCFSDYISNTETSQ